MSIKELKKTSNWLDQVCFWPWLTATGVSCSLVDRFTLWSQKKQAYQSVAKLSYPKPIGMVVTWAYWGEDPADWRWHGKCLENELGQGWYLPMESACPLLAASIRQTTNIWRMSIKFGSWLQDWQWVPLACHLLCCVAASVVMGNSFHQPRSLQDLLRSLAYNRGSIKDIASSFWGSFSGLLSTISKVSLVLHTVYPSDIDNQWGYCLRMGPNSNN